MFATRVFPVEPVYAFVDETDEQTDDDAWSFQEYDNNLFSIEYDQKWNYEDKGSSVSFNYFDGKVAFGILAGPNDQQLYAGETA